MNTIWDGCSKHLGRDFILPKRNVTSTPEETSGCVYRGYCDIINKSRNIQKSVYGKFTMPQPLNHSGNETCSSCSRPKQGQHRRHEKITRPTAGDEHDNTLQILRMIQNSQGGSRLNYRWDTVGQPFDLPFSPSFGLMFH